jgi:outer membrane lipoprotein SlyB
MNTPIAVPALLCLALVAGCADNGGLSGTKYGESGTSATTTTPTAAVGERDGTISTIENVKVDDDFKLGVGTAVGAVAGGILGAAVGDTKGAAAGAVIGGLGGTYAQSKMDKENAQRVTVSMKTGGTLTIVQPINSALRPGMAVRVEGSGENARVVPR